ncbi:MAG TPA: UDP-N-acetylmuramoyl-L-alanine--D-glutamate ligase [Anaerolineaceae bacterium]|nr:UDP-N-acetylmuramoyl-L-alanine--D-glutamate ligase [Anaerolineaceae bacterium]
MLINTWSGLHILILGAARQGLALARFLARQGAQVTISDQRSAEQLKSAQKSLAELPIEWVLGGHPLEALNGIDLLCLSGGVPLTIPIVMEAQRRGIPLSNDSQIFMEAVPCPVVGITGSAGKTTTTTLVGRMAQAGLRSPRRAWVGGNIGLPLVDYLNQIRSDDLVILELSSFQLELMTRSPQVGAILNITPNHLDRHGTMEAYAAAKARLLDFQQPDDWAILNREDAGSWALHTDVRGQLVSFGLKQPEGSQMGSFFADDSLWISDGTRAMELMPAEAVQLRGTHNLVNVLAASAIAWAAGLPLESILAGVEDFMGVPHRLEQVRDWHGALWYNDSIATAPERTMAAIRAFEAPLVLMLGGRDKNLPWGDLADLVHQRVEHVVVFGEAADKILQALGPVQPGQRTKTITRCQGLEAAVQAAAEVAESGDVVLLSPGGTSYDEFRDFEERGERFREWVKALP